MDSIGKETRGYRGYTFTVEKFADYSADTSWLGKYTSKRPDAWYIDRYLGFLFGEELPEPEEPREEDYASEGDYDAAFDKYWIAYDNWQQIPNEILDEVGASYYPHEYKYFLPCCGGEDYPQSMSKEEWTKCAVQDYERMEDLNRGGWGFIGLVVTLDLGPCHTCHQNVISDASVWGIESDAPDDYMDEIFEDLAHECLKQAGISVD